MLSWCSRTVWRSRGAIFRGRIAGSAASIRSQLGSATFGAGERRPTATGAGAPGQSGRAVCALGLLALYERRSFVRVLLAGDVLALLAAGGGVLWTSETSSGNVALQIALLLVSLCVVISLLDRSRCYDIDVVKDNSRHAVGVARALALMSLAAAGGAFLFGIEHMARERLITWLAWSSMAMLLVRALATRACHALIGAGRLRRRIIVAGGGVLGDELVAAFVSTGADDIEIVGVFDDRTGERGMLSSLGMARIGTFADLEHYCRAHPVDDVVVTLPPWTEHRLLPILATYWTLPVNVRIAANKLTLPLHARSFTHIGGVPMLAVFDRPLGDVQLLVKELADRTIAAILCMAFLPLMLAIALAIKLESRGPVLFWQQRYGFNNRPIWVAKFRSLFEEDCDQQARRSVTRSDSRVTAVGRFLRRTSLDELPQLVHVVSGRLALVGPRVHARLSKAGDEIFENVVSGYFARHRMKPGITGWAQINGYRGLTETRESLIKRFEHDLYYIDNWSIALDLMIVAMTPIACLRTRNAF